MFALKEVVGFGSIASFRARSSHFWCSPDFGHIAARPHAPLWAIFDHMAPQRKPLLASRKIARPPSHAAPSTLVSQPLNQRLMRRLCQYSSWRALTQSKTGMPCVVFVYPVRVRPFAEPSIFTISELHSISAR